MKPSRGRVPEPLDELVLTELAVSRTVRDVAAVLDAVHGAEPGDLYSAPLPPRSYRSELGADPGKLRIGLLTRTSFGEIHPECLKATTGAAKLLESLGHFIEDSFPKALLDPDLGERIRPMARPFLAVTMRGLGEALGRPATREDVEPYLWSATELPPVSADQYIVIVQWLYRWRRRIVHWWSTGFDLLLTPTVWEPPVTLESMRQTESRLSELREKGNRHVFFTLAFNVTGQPAISLPLHWTPEGLPIGVQLVAPFGREDMLIQVAYQVEQAQPWIGRLPPVHASSLGNKGD